MVFKSIELEKKFQREGYVVIPFLEAHKLEEIQYFLKDAYKVEFSGFHSTHFLKDQELKEKVHRTLASIFKEPIQEYLKDYTPLFGNFMVKSQGEKSYMPLHADWTYVDEEHHQSLGIWCPLVDTDEVNGMLGVVPYSHLMRTNKRGPQIPSPFTDFNQYIIDNYGKLLKVNAGEAVIYDHRTLHFSPSNLSTSVRIAINLVATPVNATLYHYASFGKSDEIECFKPNGTSFFIAYNHFERPEQGDSSIKMRQEVFPFSKMEIDKVLKQKKPNLFKSMVQFFKR